MNRLRAPTLTFLATLALAPTPAAAGPPSMTPEQAAMMAAYRKAGAPGPEHARFAAMAGTYDLAIRSWHAPGAAPASDKGTATRRMLLGNRVMLEEIEATLMGEPFTGQGLHGFDNVSGRYWAAWNDSMSTGLMVSEGSCDADGRCSYSGHYNDAASGGQQATRMTTRWSDPGTEVFEMYAPGPDGRELKTMEITYRKRRP